MSVVIKTEVLEAASNRNKRWNRTILYRSTSLLYSFGWLLKVTGKKVIIQENSATPRYLFI